MFKVGDVVSVKLTSSEEVIGRYVEETSNTILLKKPLAFMMGQQGIGLIPYAFSAPEDAELAIWRTAVVSFFKTTKQVADQYMKQTTGLIV
jgi:hypothetical protein